MYQFLNLYNEDVPSGNRSGNVKTIELINTVLRVTLLCSFAMVGDKAVFPWKMSVARQNSISYNIG